MTKVLEPDGSHALTATYDETGRVTAMSDPDRGSESYSYDAGGNLTQSVDARGANGTVYAGYDGTNRQVWRNTTNSPTGAYLTYSYDSTANGSDGIGHLTGESFTGGPNHSLAGAYSYVYDQRGQQTSETETVNSTNYTVGTTYDDAGNVLTKTYPDGEVVTNQYTAQEWLAGLTTQQGSNPAMTLLSNVTYSGVGGAVQAVAGASLGGGVYTYAASYDALLRLTDTKLTRVSDGVTIFEESRGFDGVGNVSSIATTLPQGTDNQAFCYDEQNRLTWASSASGTIPCGGTNTAGTLTGGGVQYTQSFSYDNLGRLTSGPLGGYTYGDSAHLHAVTSIGSTYTAAYGAAGNMYCRAPTSSTTCSGTQTGAQMSYDNEGHLISWQNQPGSSPTSTDAYLYDGEGRRVEQQSTSSGTTTTTVYVGNVEEVSTTGGTIITTTYYYAGALRLAEAVNGVVSYLASNALGSVSLAVDANGNVQAAALYAPYGGARYQNGTMPGSYGFTGQRSDSATGLGYYNARYYDPTAGQFISPDPAGDGLDLFAYVRGNPETLTDPTGLITGGICVGANGGFGGGGFVDLCFNVGWSSDDGWSAGTTVTVGGGGYGGIGGGVGVGGQISNANSVDDLGGWFGYEGAGSDVGVGADGTIQEGSGQKGRGVWVAEGQVSAGADAHVYGGASHTWVAHPNCGSTLTCLAVRTVSVVTRVGVHAISEAFGRAKAWAGQQVSRAKAWVGQQVSRAKAWAGQQVQRATRWFNQWSRQKWFDQQIEAAQSWIGAAQSWVGQQVAAAQSWVGQQARNWFGW